MATPAHCAYCFESLAASLERRQQLNLQKVEELWARWEALNDDENDLEDEVIGDASPTAQEDPAARPAAISRLLAPSPSSSSSSLPSLGSSNAATESSSGTPKSSTSLASSIGRRLRGHKSPAEDTQEFPLFVTWNTVHKNGSKSLRGCIGTFEAQDLGEGLKSYSLTSAFDDTRFSPIPHHALPTLSVSITLLTNFEPASTPMSWDVGTHGLRISFTHQGRRYGATYLPNVAEEQGWGKEETLVSLMRKAGWNGSSRDWKKVADLNVVRYQGLKWEMGYAEWREWRDWVEETEGLGAKRALN